MMKPEGLIFNDKARRMLCLGRRMMLFGIMLSCLLSCPLAGKAQARQRMAVPRDMSQWIRTTFAKGKQPPFSFVFDGKPSATFIAKWKHQLRKELSDNPLVVKYTATYTDPASGLQVECRVTGYDDFNAVDWTLHFTNASGVNSPTISCVKAVDYTAQVRVDGSFCLFHLGGSHAKADDFTPFHDTLQVAHDYRFAPENGRSSDTSAFPFFQLEAPDGHGVELAIGWSGTWVANFMPTDGKQLTFSAGQETLETFLYPGETIRTPLISMLFWKDADRMAGHNKFRRFMLAHNMRTTLGQNTGHVPLFGGVATADIYPCEVRDCLTEEVAITYMHRHKFFDIVPDAFWLDAGWYDGCIDLANATTDVTWYNKVGNWYPDPARFPNGMKPLADVAHEMGSRLMMWFEPERVHHGTQLVDTHPEWLLEWKFDQTIYMFDFGNEEARKWMCQHIGDFLEQNGIDFYRHDFNIRESRYYWAENDEPGRKGMRELRHIEGLYAFFDYLLQRFPNMLIDNCASGGRRLDIEMYRRSVPLWRTDYTGGKEGRATGNQSQTYGLNFFLPVHGINAKEKHAYDFLSAMSGTMNGTWPLFNNSGMRLAVIRARQKAYKALQPYFIEDYYPLSGLDHLLDTDRWMAYQLHRPSDHTGLVFAFRRQDCKEDSVRLSLHAVEPDKTYYLYKVNTDSDKRYTFLRTYLGQELIDGLRVEIKKPVPGAMLLMYSASEITKPDEE